MTTPLAFFELDATALVPTDIARSSWSQEQMVGPAVCGALARALEHDFGADQFVPSRLTVDLFKAVRVEALHITTASARDGNRIRVGDATIVQDGEVVSRASAVFLRRDDTPPGEYWTRTDPPEVPPGALPVPAEERRLPFWGSDANGWTRHRRDHQSAGRKRIWVGQFDVVAGEPNSPFLTAVTAGELTSMVTNWGSEGVGYINADLTLALSRLPVEREIGIEADQHIPHDGIAVGTATLFDSKGVFGTGLTTAVANAKRLIDYSRPPA